MTLSLALVFLFEEGTFMSRDQCVATTLTVKKLEKHCNPPNKIPAKIKKFHRTPNLIPAKFKKKSSTAKLNSRQICGFCQPPN